MVAEAGLEPTTSGLWVNVRRSRLILYNPKSSDFIPCCTALRTFISRFVPRNTTAYHGGWCHSLVSSCTTYICLTKNNEQLTSSGFWLSGKYPFGFRTKRHTALRVSQPQNTKKHTFLRAKALCFAIGYANQYVNFLPVEISYLVFQLTIRHFKVPTYFIAPIATSSYWCLLFLINTPRRLLPHNNSSSSSHLFL